MYLEKAFKKFNFIQIKLLIGNNYLIGVFLKHGICGCVQNDVKDHVKFNI